MNVLGIETSGLEGSIALIRDGQAVGERHLNVSGRRHAQSLVLEIHELMISNALSARDINAIAVSKGPGSFTGLRVGMVCAKTFAYATGCQFVMVDTFAAIAENLAETVRRTFVVEDAQRDDLFVGEYNRDDLCRWIQSRPIRIESVDHFIATVAGSSDVVTGPGLKKLDPGTVPSHWLPQPEYSRPTALTIAELGLRRILSNDSTDAADDLNFWKATPFYVRQSAAEEKRAQS